MTPSPHTLRRPAAHAAGATAPTEARDVLWGRPVFKAPQLNVRPLFEPFPFTAARITRAPRRTAATAAA